jgi:hypothetical protein
MKDDVTTIKILVKIPQVQDSQCPKCGKEAHRQFLMTDGSTQFGCLNGHDFVSWAVQPKLLEMPESDLVGLLFAWHYGNIPQSLEVVRKGTMIADKKKEEKRQ